MKKICHVTSAHPPEDGRIFRRECVSSAIAGYETYLVERGESSIKDGVHIVGIGNPKRPGRLYRMTVFAWKTFLAAKTIDADLYHLHDPELLPYALKLKKAGKAVVFDSHENYAEQIRNKTYLPKAIAKAASYCFARYSNLVYSKIDALTYPGNDDYPSVYAGKSKMVVSTDNFPWLSELYDRYNSNIFREPNTACYVGGLDEARGITQIIKACYLAKCKLYLGGSFSSDLYKKQLMEMQEYSCVEYLGVLDRNQVIQLLQKTQIGLCCLLNVGQYYKMINLPTKVYEYMSMAIPTIMNNSPYNEKVCRELKIGLCEDPMNLESLSNMIRALLDDPKKCKLYGENGRKAIREKFCWDNEQKKLLSMYETILG